MKTISIALLTLAVSHSAFAIENYEITTIGLYDGEHTDHNGFQYNAAVGLNSNGYAAGLTERYSGALELGQSAWIYDGFNTSKIGLTGGGYTRQDGYQFNSIVELNQTGQVIGEARRYNGNTDWGQSAWLYSNGMASAIGLEGATYTSGNGYQFANAVDLNDSGQVLGESRRYTGNTDWGQSTWLYNGNTSVRIGFTDAVHTRQDGYQASFSRQLTESGMSIGRSLRYDGMDLHGQSAWLHDGNTTIRIGLTGAQHTANDGLQFSEARFVNDAGQVAGRSDRYTFLGYRGSSAWLYNGTHTIEIGLTGGAYTRSNGFRINAVSSLNSAGQVAGTATRYDVDDTSLGIAAWLYDGLMSVDIGLADTEHTGQSGYRESQPVQINDAGQVVGRAIRYKVSNSSFGRSAWLYNGSDTVKIGLTDGVHAGLDDIQDNTVVKLNDAGQVSGIALRYDGDVEIGQTAWFYDDDLDQTFGMDFSVRASDGFAFSDTAYLGEDGLMLGYYTLFDDITSATIGDFAFGFTLEDGFFDLGLQVTNLDAAGWLSLANAIMANDHSQIIGHGSFLEGRSEAAYLLTPTSAVPVPPAVWLFGSGLIGLVGVARRRQC